MSYNGTVEGWLGVVEMTLTAGTKLEPHEVVAPLGASGKGEVYRARNTRLARAAVCQRKFESVEDAVRAYQALTNEEVKPAASHSL